MSLPPLGNTRKEMLGTLNPEALQQPVFKKAKSMKAAYEEIAQLSQKVEALKQKNTELHEKLDSMVNAEEPTPFCQFKKWEYQFQDRLKSREAELNDFAQYLGSFRVEADPTFVEVDACRHRKPRFDPITLSLLVSNQQKGFFSRNDLERQNTELGNLIAQQEYVLRLLQARLRLFEDYQNTNSVKQTIAALKQGETPLTLAGAAPTRSVELRIKRRLLTNELKALVAQRQELMKPVIEEKMQKREERARGKQALKIQKLIRGFLARLEIQKMSKAAVKIQKVVRGYLARLQTKFYLETEMLVQTQRDLQGFTSRSTTERTESTENTTQRTENIDNFGDTERTERTESADQEKEVNSEKEKENQNNETEKEEHNLARENLPHLPIPD